METTQQTLDLRDILWRARRYRWLLGLPPVFLICAASVYLAVTKPRYESNVTVAIGDQAQVSPALESFVQANRDQDSPRDRMLLVDNKVHSRAFLETLVQRLGLAQDPEVVMDANEASRRFRGLTADEFAVRIASSKLAKLIRVTPVQGSFVRITCGGGTPESARQLASLIADVLIEQSKQAGLERVQARGEFSADQIAVAEDRLRKSEQALQDFQESQLARNLTGNPIRQDNIDLARGVMRSADQEIDQIRTRLESERQEWEQTTGGSQPSPDLSSARATQLESRLSDLEISYGAASLQGGDANRDLPAIQANIGSARQELYTELESIASALPGDLSDAARGTAAGIALDRSVIRTLRAKKQRMQSYLNDFARGVESSPRQDLELARLKSDVESNRELLNTLRREATSSRLSEALETSELGLKLAVVEPPQLPLKPAAPDPFRILGGAFLLGPLFSAGIVLVGERVAAVIRTVEQAEAELGAKVVGTVPRIEGWSRPGSFMRNNWPALSIVLVILITGLFHTLHATVLSDRTPVGRSTGQSR